MKYWEALQSKWGFDDGEAVPPDAWASRYVYVREVNWLAAASNSAVRVVAFDRPGVHNPYLVCRVPAGLVRDVPPEDLSKGANAGGWVPEDDWPEPEADDALGAAIDAAMDMDLDDLVEVGVSIADEPGVECPVVA